MDATTLDTATPRPLPGYLILFIGLAMLVLWLCLLVIVIAMIWTGTGLNLTSLVPSSLEPAMRSAMYFQYGVIFLNLLILFGFGNLICLAWLVGAHEIAAGAMIWLIRLLMTLAVIFLFSSVATPFAIGGAMAAAPTLITQIPPTLIAIAIMAFAERTLVHRHTQA